MLLKLEQEVSKLTGLKDTFKGVIFVLIKLEQELSKVSGLKETLKEMGASL